MSSFEPIAIIGQGCVLPGAHSPAQLWQAVARGDDLTDAARGEDWGIDSARVMTEPGGPTTDRTWSDRGGYIRGFEQVFDPGQYRLDPEQVAGLNSGVQWCLHAAREALLGAGLAPFDRPRGDVGVILGNLAYAPRAMQDYTARFWLTQGLAQGDGGFGGHPSADLAGIGKPPAERFFSAAAPAQLTARAIGAGGTAFCLDAACASSLYAIKLACEQLQDGKANLMLAGAVNHADDLYLHIGFTALQALSRQGIARPFDRQADGLVPGAGAAIVALKRLDDARRDGDNILGVIRGIGLSNDGRAGGFLSPSSAGQVRAMRAAYRQCDLQPQQLSYLECHATGTSTGDATELQSIREVFGSEHELALASLKGNIGHLITAAGAAGLIRLLAAMQHAQMARSIHVDTPIDGLDGGPLRLLREPETWSDRQPRIAGLNAFGFGGNNAHMIVQQQLDSRQWPVDAALQPEHGAHETIVITGVAVRTANCDHPQALVQALLAAQPAAARTRLESIDIPLPQLGFPPTDLDHTLGQQLLIMQLVRELAGQAPALDHERTSVLVGMGTDPNTTRYATRTRLAQWVEQWRAQGLRCDDSWLAAAKDAISPGLTAAGVLGTMPNMPANRSNHQLDLRGPSYTVAAEELGGAHCVQIAQRSLQHGDIDAAIVGAVDLSDDDVYRHALQTALGEQTTTGDAAVALLLKRKCDAERDGDPIVAELAEAIGYADRTGTATGDEAPSQPLRQWAAPQAEQLRRRFGHCHAAFGLLNIATAALLLQHRLTLDTPSGRAGPDLRAGHDSWLLQLQGLDVNGSGSHAHTLGLRAPAAATAVTPANPPRLHRFAAADTTALSAALAARSEADDGAVRLAIIAADPADLAQKMAVARQRLTTLDGAAQAGVSRLHDGVFLATQRTPGELGFVFTGAASAYPGMGRELLMALPDSVASTIQRFPALAASQAWLDPTMPKPASEFAVLQGCSLLSQIHARITLDLLELKPQAMLGVSSGETNSVFAAGAWHDMDAMFREIDESGMYQRWIAGDFQAARTALSIDHAIDWQAYRVIAPAEALAELLAAEPRVFLTMINAARDCVVGGEREALAKVLPRIEALASAVVPLGHDIIAHCPVMSSWEAPWRAIHSRATTALPALRFYSNASGGSYRAEREAIADALTHQATDAVDFRRVVEAAYADGVRIFVEHGPRPLCSQWISATLGSRPHLSVHLDRPGAGLAPLYEAAAQLWCAGVAIDHKVLDTMSHPRPPAAATHSRAAAIKTLAAHPPAVTLPPLPQRTGAGADHLTDADGPASSMPRAPELSSALNPALADDPATVQAIERALLSAPRPAYTMPDASAVATQRPLADGVINANPAPLHATASAASTPTSLSAFALAGTSHHAALTVARLHAQWVETQRHYMATQAHATAHLLRAHRSLRSTAAASQTLAAAPLAPPLAATVTAGTTAAPRAPLREVNATDTRQRSAPRDDFPGPRYDRQQLEILAGGRISEVLGPLFEQQDDFERQVRMPCPPLLLADRVLGIDATPGAMENTGTIWTETDVGADAWYLHHGHMPAGIMIEAGQADLLLISWMGADFENRGERVYRLLGCELTYRASLPAIDDTLRYDIHVDGYAKQGDVRLFFFHYNCAIEGQRRLEVRHGQAGFFTHQELADSSGVIWQPEQEAPRGDLRVDEAPQATAKTQFSAHDIAAFADGDLVACFGPGFEAAHCHQRTPSIAAGKLLLFDRVTELDHRGGPWQRGYIRAELDILPDHWFFDGHFKNDPCMPGTLMFEGGMQIMAFYLASLGFSLPRDGWRFEPVKDEAFKLKCRSQLIPGARSLVCELFVHGVEAGTTPRLRADMLCSVDGRKAFLGQSVGIELVPGWPQESRQHLLPERTASTVARDELFGFDERAMVACAWGRPSQAFGPHYARHDGPRRGPRLPGYPYHFISRVTEVDAAPRAMKTGGRVTVEYDVPADAWYFAENGQATMPFPVLLEAALQPCGWLATFMGGGFQGEEELFFRNLDGSATWHADVLPDAGQLRTTVENTSVSQMGSMTIVGFNVRTSQGVQPIYEMETVFGFFPAAALADQAGLPSSADEAAAVQAPGNVMRPLRQREAAFFNRALRLPGPMLCLLDRVTHLLPSADKPGTGHIRAEMDVDPKAWYFKSHFYGDPVQPGSLGLDMMLQCLQYFAIDQELGRELPRPRFAAVAEPHSWSYRGQVLPHNQKVICDLQVSAIERQPGRIELLANATLWADGTKIYRADQLGLAIVDAEPDAFHAADLTLDRQRDDWVNDHCPTWTVPALPMTCMLDQLVDATAKRCPGKRVIGLSNVRASRWLDFNEPVRHLHSWAEPVSASAVEASLLAWEAASGSYETVAKGRVLIGEQYRFAPTPWPALGDAQAVELPYASATLFHGPAFQGLRALKMAASGSSAQVDAGHGEVPRGALNPGFLDACLHGIPHDQLQRWFPELKPNVAAYPLLVLSAALYGPTPTQGLYRVEARPRGLHKKWKMPHIGLQVIAADDQLWAEIELLEAVLPKGPIGSLEPARRRAFITEHQFQADARLSQGDVGCSRLDFDQVRSANWLQGTLQQIYHSSADTVDGLSRAIVAKEHCAIPAKVHPARVLLTEAEQGLEARLPSNLLRATTLALTAESNAVSVIEQGDSHFNLGPVRDYWRQQLAKPCGLEEDLFLSLASRFVASLQCDDAALVDSRGQRGVLFLANHQVGVESMLFSILMGGFMRQKLVTLAKQEHRDSWIGRMLQVLFGESAQAPDLLHLLNRDDPKDVLAQMTRALGRVAAGQQSLLVHAGGTRALRAAEPLPTVSTTLIGAAVAAGVDIVPLAFRGGLPLAGVEQRLEFPVDYGRQHFVLGPRLRSEDLRALTAVQQKERVLAALDPMLTDPSLDRPADGDPAFAEAVARRVAEAGVNPVQAALWLSLQQSPLALSAQSQRLFALTSEQDTAAGDEDEDRWLRAVSEVVFGCS